MTFADGFMGLTFAVGLGFFLLGVAHWRRSRQSRRERRELRQIANNLASNPAPDEQKEQTLTRF
jgi:hypothetical protein